jgi:hypothetical protein
VTYSISVPLDGDITGPDGGFEWTAPDDEVFQFRARVYPVLVGGGSPFFPQRERRVDLDFVETRTFSSKVVYLRYRVAR